MKVITYKKMRSQKATLRSTIAGLICHDEVSLAKIVNVIDFRRTEVIKFSDQQFSVIECADIDYEGESILVDVTGMDKRLSDELFDVLQGSCELISTRKELMIRGKSLAKAITGKKRLGKVDLRFNPMGASLCVGGVYMAFLGMKDGEDDVFVI